MASDDLSIEVFQALDSMGYSFETVKRRQVCDLLNLHRRAWSIENLCEILAGSVAEGISVPLSPNGDVDIMFVSTDMIVFENTPDSDSVKEDDCVLIMESENVAPGYTKIRCINKSNKKSSIKPICFRTPYIEILNIVEVDGSCYLKHSNEENEGLRKIKNSPVYESFNEGEGGVGFQFSGPAFNIKIDFKSFYSFAFDMAYAIPCFCSSHIQKWATRTRYYGWPGKQFFSRLKNQIGYVVPVGFKDSMNFDLEWRICYTEIETSLVRSLNETQIKMYVLLKMVAKAILKPICKDITSYVIKNLVLWIAERNAHAIFTPENLMSLVMLGLRSLRNKVDLRLCPSYMIPERNLFAGKITEHEKLETVRVLDEILAHGPTFLMRFTELDELSKAINDVNHRPLLAEIMTRTWYCLSGKPLDKLLKDENSCLRVVYGIILLAKYSKIDDHSKEILKTLIFETENISDPENIKKISIELYRNKVGLCADDIPSMFSNLCALQRFSS